MKTRSKILLGTTAFLVVIFLILALRFNDFYYLSLAGVEAIEVLEMGVVERDRVFFHDPMPIRYRLSRDAYVIEINRNLDHGSPTIWIKAATPAGANLALEQSRDDRCDSWWDFSQNSGYYEYSWSNLRNCLPVGEEAEERQVIGLVVRNEAGDVIGEESLPFEIVRNGTIVRIDSI